jgi:hypothetical protein
MSGIYNKNAPPSGILSQKEVEEQLDNCKNLPSYSSVSFADASPQAKQQGAIYALGEFLQKTTQNSSFDKLLSEIQEV